MPENFQELVAQAVLNFGNMNTRVSQDVISQQFIGPTAEVLRDSFSGKYSYDSIYSGVSTGGPTSIFNIPIGIRERADYDSARITVNLS